MNVVLSTKNLVRDSGPNTSLHDVYVIIEPPVRINIAL